MPMRSRSLFATAVAFILASPAIACPFCSATGETLAGEVAQADFIVYGTLGNAQRDPSEFNKGTTDLKIELVIKDNEYLKGRKSVTIPKFLQASKKDAKQLVFFKVYDGKLDAYRGDEVGGDSKLPEYLKGAIAVRSKDVQTRLRYCFDYLESSDLVISSDAYTEFAMADYKELGDFAKTLAKDSSKSKQVLAWLKDPNARATRFGLYGLILGHCGKADDAKALRALLDDSTRSYSSGLDGVVAGYVLLDPKAGWEYLLTIVGDAKKDFSVRYAGLRTVRFFWENRPDVIPGKQVLAAMQALMTQPDLADLPIEDLRKWKQWDQAPTVLKYGAAESHASIPIVYRAILKFALSAAQADPKNAAAAEFVAKARAKDAKKVEFLESLLKDEQKPIPAPAKSK